MMGKKEMEHVLVIQDGQGSYVMLVHLVGQETCVILVIQAIMEVLVQHVQIVVLMGLVMKELKEIQVSFLFLFFFFSFFLSFLRKPFECFLNLTSFVYTFIFIFNLFFSKKNWKIGGTGACICEAHWDLDENEKCNICAKGSTGDDCLTCQIGYQAPSCTKCAPGFTGTECNTCVYGDYPNCHSFLPCPNNCSNHGSCDNTTGFISFIFLIN